VINSNFGRISHRFRDNDQLSVKTHIFTIQPLITSAKEVMFLPDFVCLFVSLSVSKITQKVMNGSF